MLWHGADMEMRRMAAGAVVGVLALAVLTGCTESPGPATTKTWCDHGNRLYSLDTEETRGETLTVVPDDIDCDANRRDVVIRPEGDTAPMPKVTGLLNGPYKPYKAAPKVPTPEPGPKVVPPGPGKPYRLTPEAR